MIRSLLGALITAQALANILEAMIAQGFDVEQVEPVEEESEDEGAR